MSYAERQSLPRGEEAAWDDGYARGHGDGLHDGKGWTRRHGDKNPYRRAVPQPDGPTEAGRFSRFPSPVGESQPGAPDGYWYGSAPQDIVEIIRSPHMTIEEAVEFIKLRLEHEARP